MSIIYRPNGKQRCVFTTGMALLSLKDREDVLYVAAKDCDFVCVVAEEDETIIAKIRVKHLEIDSK